MLALYKAEIVDMPQVCLLCATDYRGQTLEEKMLEGEVFSRMNWFVNASCNKVGYNTCQKGRLIWDARILPPPVKDFIHCYERLVSRILPRLRPSGKACPNHL